MTMDALLNSKDSVTWTRSLGNEWGRLANGNIYGVKGTKTIRCIQKVEVPKGRDVTYATFVCSFKPHKTENYRVRITVGGDRLSCPDDTGSPAVNLLEVVNGTISDAQYGARCLCADIVNYFLANPMARTEYMKVKTKFLLRDIIEMYNFEKRTSDDGFVFIAIDKGMYGLRNTAILAYDNLKEKIKPYGYHPVVGTVRLWKHETKRTKFCVCIDDFGVKTFNKNDVQHLLNVLQSAYNITIDWTGSQYYGLHLKWDYEKGYVAVSTSRYILKAVERLQHKSFTYPQFSPHEHASITYTKKKRTTIRHLRRHIPSTFSARPPTPSVHRWHTPLLRSRPRLQRSSSAQRHRKRPIETYRVNNAKITTSVRLHCDVSDGIPSILRKQDGSARRQRHSLPDCTESEK